MEPRHVLTLEPQNPEFVASAFGHDSGIRRAIEGRRLDIVIDGRPLRYWWRDWEQPEWQITVPVPDLVTRLSPSSPRAALQQLRQLRGPGVGHAPTRAELFYCATCFDVSDGILSVEISRTTDAVTWRALGWKDEEQDGDADALISNATDFLFDPVAYDSALSNARAEFRRGCRPRWSWRWLG